MVFKVLVVLLLTVIALVAMALFVGLFGWPG